MAAFHGDEHYQTIIRQILLQGNIGVFLETGAYHADSSIYVAQFVKKVYTCEIRRDFCDTAQDHIDKSGFKENISLYNEPSQTFIPRFLPLLVELESVLVFLDAHWQDDWPLEKELALCAELQKKHPGKLVVVIDDFDVPGNPRMTGSAGGGGTVGDPIYGPRLAVDPTPCSVETFGKYFEGFKQVWYPDYPGNWPGYAILSDMELKLGPDVVRAR